MHERVKNLLVEALHYDEYYRRAGYLRTGDHFSILGILTDLYDAEGWQETETSCFWTWRNYMSYLPHEVQEWAEMRTRNGQLPKSSDSLLFADYRLQDNQQMIDYLERHYQGV